MFNKLFCVILLALIGSFAFAFDQGKVETSLRHGLEEYLETGQKSEELEQALEQVELPHLFRRTDNRGLAEGVACFTCNVGLGVLLGARRRGASESTISNLIQNLCIWLKIESEPVCRGAITANVDTLIYIIDNKPELTSKKICSIILQGADCKDPDPEDWSINIPPKQFVKDVQNIPKEEKPLKVLQLTDLHYDPSYFPGSNGACDEPLCCQKGTTPVKYQDAAGYWGDFRNCDTPWHAFVDVLNHIVSQHRNLDYIYFTGDIINHKVWDTDVAGNSKAISNVLREFKETFGDVPIYPILGNHEPHPVNVFSSEGVNNLQLSTQWVFDLSAEEWKKWLPSETRETILKGGYYTVLVKPGFRIIALNSNVCYIFNWWLLYDSVDPFGQLQWLADTLYEAEKNNEKVHILSHVPSGDSSCLKNWSKEFSRIINRFAHVITAQFNGHTHNDDVVVFFSNDDRSKPINVAFNGGSLTSYSDLNPNYKVYDVDPSNFEVLDFESWSYSISEANLVPQFVPNWYKLYSFKAAYEVENLQPQTLADLVEKMTKIPEFTKKYFRFKHREAEPVMSSGCNKDCELNNLCHMVTFANGDTFHCEYFTEIYNNNRQ